MSKFTVEERGNCVLVFGALSASGMKGVAVFAPEHGKFVQRQYAKTGLSEAAIDWLASGARGNSSETMFTHLTGVDANRGSRNENPYDPDDMRRCRLLLEQVPELASSLPKMATVSKQWARLVHDWDLICATMDQECADWRAGKGSAPKTYNLIKIALGR